MKRILSFGLAVLLVLFSSFTVLSAPVSGVTANGLEYTIANSTVTINGYAKTDSSVEIPATIEKKPVTIIDQRAFYGCDSIVELILPQGLVTIGDYAFCGCESLEGITIPESVTTIGENAFLHCDNLTSITVNADNVYYSDLDGVLFNKVKGTLIKYPAKKADTSYTVPDSVTTLAEAAFYGCSALTQITLPNGLSTIGGQAFYNCESLANVVLPTGLKSLGENAFFNCIALTAVTIPDGITTLNFGTFGGCTALTQVDLGKGVTTVDEYAFYTCPALEKVTVAKDVTLISDSAFANSTDKLTLYGYADSYAETYADTFQIPFVRLDEISQEQIDREAAQRVDDLFADLPIIITEEDREAVEAARDAYDALTDAQKELVLGYDILLDAEEALGKLPSSPNTTPTDVLPLGDVNDDGNIDAKDALLVLKFAVGKVELTEAQTVAAEVDGKDGINAKDALEILKFSVGKIQQFPIEK